MHWNAPDWALAATDTILLSDIEVAVIVIDNGPPAASAALALDARVQVVSAPSNRGYSGGANIGLRLWLEDEAAPEWCVVAAHDLQVQPDTLRRLVEAGQRAPDFGILGPATTTNYAGPLLGECDGIEEREAMSGTCLLLRRACIEEIGLFDEAFGSYAEDKELCNRARTRGWRVGRVPAARAEGLGTRSALRPAMLAGNNVLFELRVNGWHPALRKTAGMYVSTCRSALRLVTGTADLAGVRSQARGTGRATRHLLREATLAATARRTRRP